jgi:beta-lactam-binding protein with PASTA domain
VIEKMKRLKLWFEKNNTILLGVTSTLVMFLVLFVLMNYVVMPLYTKQGAEVELVDVTEMPYDMAERMLEKRGFKMVHDTTTFSATYPESTVIAQNPPSYSKVKRGRRIYVTLSGGERIIKVPRVIGTSERDAIFTLRGAELIIGNTFYEYSNYYPEGTVSKQSIPAGIDTTSHSVVDISVSLGRIPSEFIVPDVVGKSFDAAKTLLWKSGLEVGSVTYQVNEKLIPFTVISQAIEPGSQVKQGKPIDLVVSIMEEEGE